MPAVEWSAAVQALPSSHAVPSGLAGFEHAPVAGLQVPASWHWSGAGQATALPPVQTPPRRASPWVPWLPSLPAAPFCVAGFEQPAVDGLHAPALWRWSATHTTGLAPVQVPP